MKSNKLLLLIPIICLVFLWPMVVDQKIPLANDSVAHIPIKKWRTSYYQSSDEFPHWFPNFFSGLPSYGGYIYTPGDPVRPLLDIFFINKGVKLWFYLTLGGLGLFYFLRRIKVSILASIFAGVVFCLTPYSFGLINGE